jgi:hypothetical protein
MSKMKVVKAEQVVETPQTENAIDAKRVEELREKFDVLQAELNSKNYDLYLDAELTKVLMGRLFNEFQWKGYESYAISETHSQLTKAVNKNGEVQGKFPVEVIEAVFHFLKNHIGTGFELAIPYKQICDQFAMVIQEINTDRQELKDLSLDLVASEQGIKVEDLVASLNKMQQQG